MTIYERGTPFSIVGRSVFSTNADPNTPTHMIVWLSYSEAHFFPTFLHQPDNLLAKK